MWETRLSHNSPKSNLTNGDDALVVETPSSIYWHFNCQPAGRIKHWHSARCLNGTDKTSVDCFAARKFTYDVIWWLEAGSRHEKVITSKHDCVARWNNNWSFKKILKKSISLSLQLLSSSFSSYSSSSSSSWSSSSLSFHHHAIKKLSEKRCSYLWRTIEEHQNNPQTLF